VIAGWFTRGRWPRGVLAWLVASVAAALFGATLTIVYLMAREAIVSPPFPPSEWWLFVNMWRPLAIAGAILVPLFGVLPALYVVALIRRSNWPRPAADMIGGAASALVALGLVIATARILSTLGNS
jgi:hypothetical protein